MRELAITEDTAMVRCRTDEEMMMMMFGLGLSDPMRERERSSPSLVAGGIVTNRLFDARDSPDHERTSDPVYSVALYVWICLLWRESCKVRAELERG